MLPFERLRYLARNVDGDSAFVQEAADCLIDFADEPELVTVCRRLVAHHPACGPLWWLCARVLADPDPAKAARDAMRLVGADRTAARLAETLPFPHDEPIALLGRQEITAEAVADRPDLDVVILALRGSRIRGRRTGARVIDEAQALALAPTHVLVEVRAAGPTSALVDAGTVAVLDALLDSGPTQLWLVAGVGHVLPERLFQTVCAQASSTDTELLDVSRATRIAGPAGLDPPERFPTRIDCPVPPELLRI